MLALVKTPLTEISIHGDGAIEIIEYLKSKFTVTVLSVAPEEKSDDELVDLTSTEWWKENKRRALAGYRLKKQLTQMSLRDFPEYVKVLSVSTKQASVKSPQLLL